MTREFTLEYEREADGRWIAEVPSVPGVMAYGDTKAEAKKKAYALLLRVLAEEIEERKTAPHTLSFAVS